MTNNSYNMNNNNDPIMPQYSVRMTQGGDKHDDGTPVELMTYLFKVYDIDKGKDVYCKTLDEAQRVSWKSIAPLKTPVLDALRSFVLGIVDDRIEEATDDIESRIQDLEDEIRHVDEKVDGIDEFDSQDIEERLNALEDKSGDSEHGYKQLEMEIDRVREMLAEHVAELKASISINGNNNNGAAIVAAIQQIRSHMAMMVQSLDTQVEKIVGPQI
jgi:hypothetical protein